MYVLIGIGNMIQKMSTLREHRYTSSHERYNFLSHADRLYTGTVSSGLLF